METANITFLPHNRTISVSKGETLIRAALQAGVHINAPCGGGGVCGKCRVRLEEGAVAEGISERLNEEDVAKGYRLACLSKIEGDVIVRVPVESGIDAAVLNQRMAPRHTAKIQAFDISSLKEKGLFSAPVDKIYLELPSPNAANNTPDVSRLVSGLRHQGGLHKLELTLSTLRRLPAELRQDDFRVTVTVIKPVREDGKNLITNIQSGDHSADSYALAVDIGTTTVYAQLIDLHTGEIKGERGDFNGQISYGEDVISRIMYAESPGGLTTLQSVIIGTINRLIGQILDKSSINRQDIATITIAGNTTMTQLLLAIDPRHIRRAPYVPATALYPSFAAQTIGLDLAEHTMVLLCPQVSSYIGGDIVAGVMGTGIYRDDELTLFLDIGTNAEVVVGNKDWLACAACSAGPAFEGGGIEFGMRASKGAIEDFSLDPVTWEPMLVTIGDAKPRGICGSGLLTMVALMFEMGMIDNTGKFNRDLGTNRIREGQHGVWEYVLARRDATDIDRDIVLSETDIEHLIRAKAAIYSGCMTLLSEVGLGMEQIERIVLAGGFGSYIDLEKAMTLGLLPEVDPDRIHFIGNGSLLGARMSALTNKIRYDVVEVIKKMTNFELSETPSYMSNYTAAMFLPHTDIEKFPRLRDRLEARKRLMASNLI
ncbi:MAG: ASKHA domain-containing protein [Desulfobulbaceae bacterium]|jgi:uncharacterized 2Fe-2S/4Fe-4S cluster protein (DUF4445 family)|nr:ASKHA domain-containing protein [Desulfobulbaceae bacterium]